MSNSTTFAGFQIDGKLAVDVLLGTAFIEKHVKIVSPTWRRISMIEDETTVILESAPKSNCAETVAKTNDHHVKKMKLTRGAMKHCRVLKSDFECKG